MAQRLKDRPQGRKPGHTLTMEQRDEIRQRTFNQWVERKEKRNKNNACLKRGGDDFYKQAKVY